MVVVASPSRVTFLVMDSLPVVRLLVKLASTVFAGATATTWVSSSSLT